MLLDKTPNSNWPVENLQRELEGVSGTMKHIQGREMRAAGIEIVHYLPVNNLTVIHTLSLTIWTKQTDARLEITCAANLQI